MMTALYLADKLRNSIGDTYATSHRATRHTCKRQDQSCATKAPGVTPHLATSHGARVMKVAYSNTLHKIWLDYVQSLTD